jgi:anti-sigma28 factor (negative regulator of flagellin synthesis)
MLTLQIGPNRARLVDGGFQHPMSMQIHNDGIAGPAASQPAPVESVAQPGSSTRIGMAAESDADQVEISSLFGNIASGATALAEQQAARVSQLAALHASGQYQVDSTQLSRALVSEAIASGSAGEDS